MYIILDIKNSIVYNNYVTISTLPGDARLIELKNRLRTLRFMNGEMTQQELADKVGVTRQTIYAIESGKFNPSVKLAILIAGTFRVSVEDAFYLEGEQNG
jgi:putative transcriptional regulator